MLATGPRVAPAQQLPQRRQAARHPRPTRYPAAARAALAAPGSLTTVSGVAPAPAPTQNLLLGGSALLVSLSLSAVLLSLLPTLGAHLWPL